MPITGSADPGTITLDGMAFKLAKAQDADGADLITVSQLSAYEPGVTIGAVDVNSHPILSTWGISDLSGGHGLANHQAGVTDQRYRYASADVTRPQMWAPPLAVAATTGTSAAFWPCGDLLVSGNVEMYGAFGTDLHLWNESTDTWTDTTNNLTAAPVNTGVAFKGTGTLKLFIPMGASGYATYTGAVFANVGASGSAPAAKAFCIFGSKSLICLDTVGQLWHSEDGTTWNSSDFGADGKIDGSLTANWLYEGRDVMGNPALFIVTTGGVFVFDPAGPTLYQLDLQFPNHPSQGLTACSWRGADYIAVGLGVHDYVSGNVGAMGLDRDEGLPANYGYGAKIVSLVGEYNDMYALVQGDGAVSTETVQRWTGFGWHRVWESEVSATATRLYVSGARGKHRVWWGHSTFGWTLDLPIAFTNPRQLLLQSVALETGRHYLLTGYNNMGMPGSRKIAHSVGIRVDMPDGIITLADPPVIKYRINGAEAFNSLVSCVGPKTPGGADIVPDGSVAQTYYYWLESAFQGVAFEEIELYLEWESPWIIKWLALYFGKAIAGNLAWTATLDLTEKHENNSPAAMHTKLDDLTTSGQVYSFVYRKTPYNARVSSWSGQDSSGRADTRGMRSVQILQVKDRP